VDLFESGVWTHVDKTGVGHMRVCVCVCVCVLATQPRPQAPGQMHRRSPGTGSWVSSLDKAATVLPGVGWDLEGCLQHGLGGPREVPMAKSVPDMVGGAWERERKYQEAEIINPAGVTGSALKRSPKAGARAAQGPGSTVLSQAPLALRIIPGHRGFPWCPLPFPAESEASVTEPTCSPKTG
jgi:hypothetical protein